MLSKSREHASCNTNHVLHLGTNQTQNCHVGENTYITAISKLRGGISESLDLLAASMNGHGNVHLRGRDKIDGDGVMVENREDTSEETV